VLKAKLFCFSGSGILFFSLVFQCASLENIHICIYVLWPYLTLISNSFYHILPLVSPSPRSPFYIHVLLVLWFTLLAYISCTIHVIFPYLQCTPNKFSISTLPQPLDHNSQNDFNKCHCSICLSVYGLFGSTQSSPITIIFVQMM
jgi:hypothetical protein